MFMKYRLTLRTNVYNKAAQSADLDHQSFWHLLICIRMSEISSEDDSEMLSDEDEVPPPTSFDIEAQLLSENYNKNLVRIFPSGEKMTYAYLAETGFEWPMLFRNTDGLGLKLPDKK